MAGKIKANKTYKYVLTKREKIVSHTENIRAAKIWEKNGPEYGYIDTENPTDEDQVINENPELSKVNEKTGPNGETIQELENVKIAIVDGDLTISGEGLRPFKTIQSAVLDAGGYGINEINKKWTITIPGYFED